MQTKVKKVFLGNKEYPLLSWLMTLHKEGDHNLLEMFYNREHKRTQFFVENAFGIRKTTFHEFKGKT
jgi:hypothetical protein